MGRTTVNDTTQMIATRIMICLWKERYWTASYPLFAKIFSSLEIEIQSYVKYSIFLKNQKQVDKLLLFVNE